MSDDYAPFPEQALVIVALYHEEEAAGIWQGTWAGETHAAAAKACRDAITAHAALRERCLLAELERDHGVKAEAAD